VKPPAVIQRPEDRVKPADIQRVVTVVIDPGHGGEDPGAVGHGGRYEKTVTPEIEHRLREMIAAEPQMRVAMTRDGDFFVPLRTRVAKARAVHADLFVFIQAHRW